MKKKRVRDLASKIINENVTITSCYKIAEGAYKICGEIEIDFGNTGGTGEFNDIVVEI